MRSYFDHIPERFHEDLRQAIEAVTETRMLLDQVIQRFGTKDTDGLRALIGQLFDGVRVTEDSVVELETLLAEHEARREACRALLATVSGGELPDGQSGETEDS